MTSEEHQYEMQSSWVREKIVTIEVNGKPTLQIATPLDFWPESPTELYSPEDLFLASAVSCFGVSIHGVSKRFHAEFSNFHVSASANLVKGEYGWEFEKISISAKIFVTDKSQAKKMEKVADLAHRYCVVANSMKCPVIVDSQIVVTGE